MNLSPGGLGELSAQQKRQLLTELLQKRSSQPKDRPLSVGQERLCRLVLLTRTPLYNVAVAYRLLGSLNIKAMEQAVRRIEARHETLRTTFPLADGEPIQRIAPAQTRSDEIPSIDLQSTSQVDRAKRANAIIESEITRVIDLAQAPLGAWRLFA